LFLLFLVLLGAYFLSVGLGGVIPLLEYKGAKATGLPIGVVFLIAAVLLAKFWDVSSRETRRKETEYGPDGRVTKIKEIFESVKRFNEPGGPQI
jgi:hypothetical protein